MKKLLLALICILCITACMRDEKVYVRSYVVKYYELDHFNYMPGGGRYIILDFSIVSGKAVDYGSKGDDKKYYDMLCQKHNDMSYNREVIRHGSSNSIWYHDYLATDFVSVDIISDSDFDESHMAGESLGDIVSLCSMSPVPYINSGYKATYNWKEADDVASEILSFFTQWPEYFNVKSLHPVYKHVSDLTPDDLYLLGDGDSVIRSNPWGVFKFEQMPTFSKEHEITITMIADDGKAYIGKVNMVFD